MLLVIPAVILGLVFGSMSVHTINRPVPRVLAMAVSLASRAFNTAAASEAREEIGCLPVTAPRQIQPGDYNATAAAFRRKPAGYAMAERETKHIIRQWNREIEDETRRLAARGKDSGPWRAVVWGAMWVLWLGALLALIALLKPWH